MAAIHEVETQFHEGEQEMHRLMKVPESDNPTSHYLSPFAATALKLSPLIALGTLDEQGRPWSTIWGGEPGFAQAYSASLLGIKSIVARYDPVLEAISKGNVDGEMIRGDQTTGMMISGLTLDLATRRRVKLYGRLVGGTLSTMEDGAGEVLLAVKIEQSLGEFCHGLQKYPAVH